MKRTQCRDMRANNHMCTFKNMFLELNELKSGHVTFRYAFKFSIKDNDKILICLKIKNNILNLHQLLKNGYDIHMEKWMFLNKISTWQFNY